MYCHITVVARVHNFIIDSQVLVKVNTHKVSICCVVKGGSAYESENCATDKWISCDTPSRGVNSVIARSNKGGEI